MSPALRTREQSLAEAAGRADPAEVAHMLERRDVADLGRRQWRQGEAPLHEASACGRDATVRLLVSAGVDVNSVVAYDDGERISALHWAAYHGQASTARLLVRLGADVDVCCDYSDEGLSGTAAQWAARRGFHDIARMLLLEESLPIPSSKPQ